MTNPRLIKIAVSFGDDQTGAMIGRQNRFNQPLRRFDLDGPSLTLLGASSDNVQEDDQGILIVAGLPLGVDDTRNIRSAQDMVLQFQQADGAFAALYWDKQACELTIVTDFLGAQPLYSWTVGNSLHLAGETKAFDTEPDPAGWGAFLAFGHPIGERTLGRNVRRLPGGSVIKIDTRSRSARITNYWSPPSRRERASVGDVARAFRDSVQAYEPYGRDGTILLSGGYDSRLVLFGLMEAGIPVKARVFSHRDENFDADRRIAEKLAQRHGIEFDTIFPDRNFFSTEGYLDYLSDTDAQTRSLHLYIAQLGPHIPGPSIWEGWGPGPTLGSRYFPGGGFDTYIARSCSSPGSGAWKAAQLILQPDFFREMEDGFRQDLEAEIARFPDDDYGVYWFFGMNRSRNRTGANTFKAFPQYAAPCLPGFSRTFWEAASSIPQEEKLDHRYFRRFLAETYPEALEFPFVTGSTLMPGKNRFSPYYRSLWAAVAAKRFVGTRPRLTQSIPFLSRAVDRIEPSRWLNFETLANDDDHIDQERLSRLNPDDPLYDGALTFLFHWKAWRWLHQGRLKERFLDLPGA